MYLAVKNVLFALFALSTLFAVSLTSVFAEPSADKPEAKMVSDSPFQAIAGTNTASEFTLTAITALLPQANIASFNENKLLLSDMQSVKFKLVRKSEAKYASAKSPNLTIAIPDSDPVQDESQPQIVRQVMQFEVKGEAVSADTYALSAEVLLGLVNQHRAGLGLAVLQTDESVMQVARERSSELFDEIFVNGNMHAGFYARNLPYRATENIIYNHTEEGAFQWWIRSYIHRAAIENPEHTHTGVACSGKTCSMIFTHFEPK